MDERPDRVANDLVRQQSPGPDLDGEHPHSRLDSPDVADRDDVGSLAEEML